MNAAAATGRAMNAEWLPLISSIVAAIRPAMNRWASGEIALSCVATWNHVRCVLHPSADRGSPIAEQQGDAETLP